MLKFMETILQYFPELTTYQIEQFAKLEPLYKAWNAKINVISRRDIDELYIHHVLHSMSIKKLLHPTQGTRMLDLGTGGGFPGIPLAILFPDVEFLLIDGTRKKLKVVEAVCDALNLSNVVMKHLRAEECKYRADFVLTRGVASLDKLVLWSQSLFRAKERNALPNGLLAFKGGDIRKEIATLDKGAYVETYPLRTYYKEPYFEEKYVLYVQR